MLRKPRVDKTFLFLSLALAICGFFIFTSASLGLLARDQAQFSTVALKQFLIGIVLGGIALYAASMTHYKHWRTYSFYFFQFHIGIILL
jgi:cell division protein FtsW (lipid II flippase)